MKRYRAVTVQNGKEHVSTVITGGSEVRKEMMAECWLHLAAGWKVSLSTAEGVYRMLAEKDTVEHGTVTREVFYREFDPMEDYESQEDT